MIKKFRLFCYVPFGMQGPYGIIEGWHDIYAHSNEDAKSRIRDKMHEQYPAIDKSSFWFQE